MFDIPDDVNSMDAESIENALKEAFAEADSLYEIEEPSDDQLSRMESIAAFIASAKQTQSERVEQAAARKERLAAARATLAASRPVEEDVEEQAEPVVEEATVEAAAKTADDEDDEDIRDKADGDAAAPVEDEPVDVDDEGTPSDVEDDEKNKKEASVSEGFSAADNAARNKGREQVPEKAAVAITAGADVPGRSLGQGMSTLSELGEAFVSKFQAMSPSSGATGRSRFNVARMNLPRTDGLVAESADAQEVFMKAASEARLPGGSLAKSRQLQGITASGWCAPSETLYDLCTNVSTDGLFTLPEVQVKRGGIRTMGSIDLSGIDIADIGFVQTETQAEAGTEKPCLEIPCPEPNDVRLDATGICIRAGLLQASAYPELVSKYIETYLALYQHRYSLDTLTKVQTLIGAPVALTGVWDNAFSLVTALELVAEGYRQDKFISPDQTVEIVLPIWTLAALRADLGNQADGTYRKVSDAELLEFFTVRKLNPQFVYHYQDLDTSAGVATTYPETIEFMMYPAGSYVRGVTDVINLDAVYDAPSLKTNTYTALFAETGMLVNETCEKGVRVSLPFVVTGITASGLPMGHFTNDAGAGGN